MYSPKQTSMYSSFTKKKKIYNTSMTKKERQTPAKQGKPASHLRTNGY